MYKKLAVIMAAAAAWALPFQAAQADNQSIPEGAAFGKRVPALNGAPPEGFTIGVGKTAYNGSVDGSIYKVNLASGEGEVLVPAEPGFDLFAGDCFKLGMRVDPRTNYLFVAGCQVGNAYVYDAQTGEEITQYELAPFGTVINDLVITRRAVYFTDFTGPFLYQLPLSANGEIPGPGASMPIPLTGSDPDDPLGTPQTANGIVVLGDGKTLIIGDSSSAQIYRVDPGTGVSDRIILDTPLQGFIDGIVRDNARLYILSPANPEDPEDVDRIYVVRLDKGMATGKLMGVITDDDLDGVASGAILGNSLYVNNARYTTFPEADTEYWLTRLKIKSTRWHP